MFALITDIMLNNSGHQIIRVLLAMNMAWTSFALAAPMGEVVPNVRSPKGLEVLHEGLTNGGRPRVFSVQEINGKPSFHYGVLEADGRITWEPGTTSTRFPGQIFWPNYGGKVGIEPLARNRSLVVSGPAQTVQGSGASEINSPGREFLPEFVEANRPSRLRRTLGYTRQNAEEAYQLGRRVVTDMNNTEALNQLGQKSAQLMEKLSGPAGSLANISSAFYIALGFVAAFELLMYGSANPAALDAYIQSLPWNDPVGVLALFGFLAGAAFFYKKLGNLGANGSMMRVVPLFAGALLAGSLISTAVSVMAQNEDVKACTAYIFHNPAKLARYGGRVVGLLQDVNANQLSCEKAYEWWTSSPEEQGALNEIANGYVPLAVNVLASSGIYLGTVLSAGYIWQKYKIGDALRTLAGRDSAANAGRAGTWLRSAAGGWGRLVIHGALLLIFMKAMKSSLGIEKWVRELLITKFGLFSNHYGRSLPDAEQNLFEEWAKVKRNGWRSPYQWQKTCFDGSRKYNMIYNCEDPDQLDFQGVLTRYNKLQNTFRATQLMATLGAYQQWMSKTSEFQEMVNTSYGFYKANLPILAAGQFSSENLQLPLADASKELQNANMNGNWKYIFTPRMQDFLLTSMACGPEAEGYRANSWWQSTRQFVGGWITGNVSPERLFDNSEGFKVRFYPPRITKPLAGENDTICEKAPAYSSVITTPAVGPMKFVMNANGKWYTGLPAYIKDNIRESISGERGFDAWWSQRVTNGALEVHEDLRKEYVKMLNDYYRPALSRRENYWCEPSPVQGTGLEKYLKKMARADDTCPAEGLHRLNYGILASSRDELRLYLAMSMDLHLSNLPILGQASQAPGQIEDALMDKAILILDLYDVYSTQLAIAEPEGRSNIQNLYKQTRRAMDEFAKMILPSSPQPPLPPFQVEWAQALIKKSTQLLIDSGNYFNVLTALDSTPKAQ